MRYAGKDPIPFSSTEEMKLWLRDKRYSGNLTQRDEGYQAHCKVRLEMTDDDILGANTDLQAAMSEPSQQFQDPNNDLGTRRDVYHDMEEAAGEINSALYKKSPYERQRVAEKIDRSTPGFTDYPEPIRMELRDIE